jgi:hypothetical protein
MKKKYVITNNGLPILFDEALIHKYVSLNYSIDSAGFFSTTVNPIANKIEVKCWGESNSLHIRSKPLTDEKIIEAFLND